jgi:adenosine deaminase
LVCCVLRTADDIRRVTYESLEIAHDAGVRYREMFFSPVFLLRKGVPFPVIWDGLVAGVRDAKTDFGVDCRLIMDVDKPSGPAAATELLELAEGCDRGLLVGIGGDAGERGFDLAAFAQPFATARTRGWRTTMHLGEEGPASDVRIGVDVLRVDRIDHGVSLIDDAALTAEVAARRLPVTCCPTSNVRIGIVDAIANHPIEAMRAAGVLVTVNSDNAEMFGVDMADELSNVSSAFGWQLAALEDLCLGGVEGAWMPDVDKDAMIAEFTSKMDALRVTQGAPTRFAPRPGLTAEEV